MSTSFKVKRVICKKQKEKNTKIQKVKQNPSKMFFVKNECFFLLNDYFEKHSWQGATFYAKPIQRQSVPLVF